MILKSIYFRKKHTIIWLNRSLFNKQASLIIFIYEIKKKNKEDNVWLKKNLKSFFNQSQLNDKD